MSVFKVQLQQGAQGALDKDPSTMSAGAIAGQGLGTPMAVSKQRQVYVMGPNRINRLLKDGDTFTDCNYWKKFAYPQTTLDNAFINVLTDDGSVYDVAGGSTVPAVYAGSLTSLTHDDIDFVADWGGPATFCQIDNLEAAGQADHVLTVTLNGTSSFSLYSGTSQVFNSGDLAITSLIITAASGMSAAYQVIAAVAATCES